MTQEFRDMLYLLGAEVSGKEYNPDHKLNIEGILRAAAVQGVRTLVFPQLEKLCPDECAKYTAAFWGEVGSGIRRNAFNLKTLSELRKKGIRVCLIKGLAAAAAYPHPEYRISSDTDILIDEKDETSVLAFLEGHGYSIEPRRSKNDHHTKARHPIGGLLEVHVQLYSIPTQKMILSGMKLYDEEYRIESFDGCEVYTLGTNDSLIYLTAHYIKHLVNEGGGIRQMLDLLLYMKKYESEIDFEKYNTVLQTLGYEKLIDVVKAVGAFYWGMDFPKGQGELCEKLLTDSEEYGLFGHNSSGKNGFFSVYCERRGGKMKNGAVQFFGGEQSRMRRLFPDAQGMVERGYKHANNKLLYPFCCIHRLLDKLFEMIFGKKKRENPQIEKRLDMMKELGMIK